MSWFRRAPDFEGADTLVSSSVLRQLRKENTMLGDRRGVHRSHPWVRVAIGGFAGLFCAISALLTLDAGRSIALDSPDPPTTSVFSTFVVIDISFSSRCVPAALAEAVHSPVPTAARSTPTNKELSP